MGKPLQFPFDHRDESRSEAFQRLRVGVQVRDLPGQGLLVELGLEPGREVIDAQRGLHQRLEEVQVEAREAHPPQAVDELGEIVGLVPRRDRESHRLHEVELLALRDVRAADTALQMPLDGLDESGLEFFEGAEPQRVDRRQPLSQPLVSQDVAHPVGEIVRWLGDEILVLTQEAMGVLVDDGNRRRLEVLQELGEIPGLEPGETREAETCEEAEWLPRAYETHGFPPSAAFASLRNRATWGCAPR